MAVTAVGSQEGGVSATGTSVTRAFGSNVTAGNIIIVTGVMYSISAATITAGDCTKSAGTATIGSVTLDKLSDRDYGGGVHVYVGIWSCQVTGSGSCTMQISDAAIAAGNIGTGEYTSGVGAIALDGAQTNAATGDSTTPDSGTVTTTRNGIIVGAMSNFPNGVTTTITIDAAFTLIFEEQDGTAKLTSGHGRRIVSGSVADSASWTVDPLVLWNAAVAAYVEPAASTVTLDMWQGEQADVIRLPETIRPSGTIGMKPVG